MQTPDAAEPWSDEEVDWIDALLMSEENGLDQPLFATEIDGFLCALLSGPNLILPSQALPWIFDAEAGEQSPSGISAEDAQRFFHLVMQQWNYIAASLMEGSYEPLLMMSQRADGSEVTQFSDWCAGYMTGVGLDREAWSRLMDQSEQLALLSPMLMYGTPEGWDAMEQEPLSDAEHEAMANGLGALACEIHAYWLARRSAPTAPRRHSGPKTGRNEPCPCGSGRKYKHCHGAN